MLFDAERAYSILHRHYQKRVHRNEPLAHHSAFGVGGAADLWLTVESLKELKDLVNLCAEQHWPLLLTGAGTNILYADTGIRGIVARMGLHDYRIEQQSEDSALLLADAGVRWTQVLRDLVPLGWGGLEFGVGIPGTLGAGIVSNAGAHDKDLGQALEYIEVLDARGCNREEDSYSPPMIRRYERDELDLGYRHSRFRESRLTHIDKDGRIVLADRGLIEPAEIVTSLALRLNKQDPKVLLALIDKHKQYRKQSEPSLRHTGSIFKDPPGYYASDLIRQTGLCGKYCGKAQISELNGNYIENHGGATAQEIVTLIVAIHQRVLQQANIHLALNVDLRGEWQFEIPQDQPLLVDHV